ncbi:MAG: tRNA pseudouridine(38-40) synthase TruA [Chitinophagaceae bacterium]
MNRYFLEVTYKGNRYAGFQVQDNAITIQGELQKVLETYFRQPLLLTGSSRTDAGVHARQNFFHVDTELVLPEKAVYNLNAMLPPDIMLRRFIPVRPDAHSRFDATAREYEYYIYQEKDPFMDDRAYYLPYKLEEDKLAEAAAVIMQYTDFTSFSKRNSQVHTFNCSIQHSEWERRGSCLVYKVRSNRFLRGMVRGLVGTMLKVGREKITIEGLRNIIEAKDCSKADFAVPGHGLFLMRVIYPDGYFEHRL